MCFSPTTSFVAAGVLAGGGAVTLYKTTHPSRRMLACTPLLFAVQQCAEGLVWLTVGNPAHIFFTKLFSHVFLSFAFVVWPLWIPISLLIAEKKARAKKNLSFLIWWGAIVAAYGAYTLLSQSIGTRVLFCSIKYDIGSADAPMLGIHLAYYVTAVVLPFFASSLRYARLFGGAVLLFLVLTYLFMQTTLTSVWCFFAAILSGIVFLMVKSR